ncbi:hypothetical protein CPB84DRAFT_1792623 [Gymnopilus junonius]|uniref:Secreted protein n=1 Tax=Gymnopilus junonius TaxID=109634 RepID=A0A9P5TIU4_GYMJU|nr:hypothetical protein CPB84DRAFT_1792623 [Gymnopilus junonius]
MHAGTRRRRSRKRIFLIWFALCSVDIERVVQSGLLLYSAASTGALCPEDDHRPKEGVFHFRKHAMWRLPLSHNNRQRNKLTYPMRELEPICSAPSLAFHLLLVGVRYQIEQI